jgi:hypothetical protein
MPTRQKQHQEQESAPKKIRQQQQHSAVIRYASKTAVSAATREVLSEHALAFDLLKQN